ncbi:isoaspartyl peptidase/L-asparaginase [Loigolactobacillus coryniformis]|uniref:isoaspartyl peptidase/L-asparaginase n=1 Tax=Loigolactobacillus coryniformis TaxID=1610 RepID=UPI00201ADFAA|nr:isoaspartyl peptidase/L-asparaginase [Loigolactobacillus coryniformis]MCL5457219.1 isoaspartyl peptidase/L-asparaginase [Loigolactobacillus coryniformis]
MTWGIISTWQMSLDGVTKAAEQLREGRPSGDAVQTAIEDVESNPAFNTVGYGGLPNAEGAVEMDAAFMNGDTLSIGAVTALHDIAHPIAVARNLSHEQLNNFLAGSGADAYAQRHGFTNKNMLTPEMQAFWGKQVRKNATRHDVLNTHDTVSVISLDYRGRLHTGTSTTGIFMKAKGRVGDAPLPGAGFYCDNKVAGVVTTGLGEDLMKGMLPFKINELIRAGATPQEACDQAVYPFVDELYHRSGHIGAVSVVALDKAGNWGVATNTEFTFVVATDQLEPTVFTAERGSHNTTTIDEASL